MKGNRPDGYPLDEAFNRAAKDFLDELVEERTAKNPAFPQLVEEATARRKENKL